MVVGAARFVPADEQGRVPDVGPGRGLHPSVGVVDAGEERLATQDRRRRVNARDAPRRAPCARPAAGW